MARILLVEDDELVRKSTNRVLERAGHEVWESTGPKTALHMLACMDVDLVITDIYMPGMSGVEMIRRMEGQDRVHAPKVIAMTGGGVTRTMDDLLSEARSAGANFTMEKPFAPGELVSAVNRVLGCARNEAVLALA